MISLRFEFSFWEVLLVPMTSITFWVTDDSQTVSLWSLYLLLFLQKAFWFSYLKASTSISMHPPEFWAFLSVWPHTKIYPPIFFICSLSFSPLIYFSWILYLKKQYKYLPLSAQFLNQQAENDPLSSLSILQFFNQLLSLCHYH